MLLHQLETRANEVQLYMYYSDKVVVVESVNQRQRLELFHDGRRVFTYEFNPENTFLSALDMFVDILHMSTLILQEDSEHLSFTSASIYDEHMMSLLTEYVQQFYTLNYGQILESYTLIRDSIRKCLETKTRYLPSDTGELYAHYTASIEHVDLYVDVYEEYIMYHYQGVSSYLHVDSLLAIFELDYDSYTEEQLLNCKNLLRNIYAKTLLPVLAEYVIWRD